MELSTTEDPRTKTAETETEQRRAYHDTGAAYVWPNDAIEQKRLDAQANAIVEMLGGIPFVAVRDNIIGVDGTVKVEKAVDVGCGTGIATLQLAQTFPPATVWGIDISPVSDVVKNIAPENVKWGQGNVLEVDQGIDEKDEGDVLVRDALCQQSVDYVFGRLLFMGVNDWARYFSTLATATKSGGIIEHQDLDWAWCRMGSLERLSDHWKWNQEIMAAGRQRGLLMTVGSDAAALMKDAGLDVLDVQVYELAFTSSARIPHSEATARYVQTDFLPNFPELLRKLLGMRGYQGEELQELIDQALSDVVSEEGVHMRYTVTIGRKL